MTKQDYTSYEAAAMIFPRCTKGTARKWINELYKLGELHNSTKVNDRWWVSILDIQRIRERIRNGEIIVKLNYGKKTK